MALDQAAAAGPHRLVLATYLDAPNRPQTHSQILTLILTLPLDARCVYSLSVLFVRLKLYKVIHFNELDALQ